MPQSLPSGFASLEATLKIGGQSVNLLRDGQSSASLIYGGATSLAGQKARITLQFDASLLASGYHDYEVTFRAKDSNGNYLSGSGTGAQLHGRTEVINRKDSEFGNRWWLPVLDQLDLDQAGSDGVGVINGDGSHDFYHYWSGDYYAEADNFDRLTTVMNGTTLEYVIETQDGLKKYFSVATGDIGNADLGLLRRIEFRNGRVQTFEYDDIDNDDVDDELVSVNDGYGGISTFTYTAGLLSSMTGGTGITWTFEHNSDSTLRKISGPEKPDGYEAIYEYWYDDATNGNGTLLMTKHQDRAGGTTEIEYDFDDRRVRSVTTNGAMETRSPSQVVGLHALAAVSSATGTVSRHGGTWEHTYDSEGRIIKEEAPDLSGSGVVEKDFVRNLSGLIESVTLPNPAGGAGLVTQFLYNSRGKLTKITYPPVDGSASTTHEYTYAANGLDLIAEKDQRGKIWTYEVDSATGLRTKMTDPTGRITRYEYYATDNATTGAFEGMLWKIIEQKGANPSSTNDLVTTFEYDTRGNVKKTTYADGTFRTAVYNQAKNTLTTETDERGFTTTYTYDAYNRRASATLPDPDGNGPLTSPVWQYVFCTCGHLTEVTDPLGNVTTYDYSNTTGKLLSVTSADPDDAGPLTSLVTTYEYYTTDDIANGKIAGELWKEIAPGNRVTEYRYNVDGSLKKIILPDPDSTDSDPAPAWQYAYDVLGQLKSVTDPEGKITGYGYDALGRLVSETDPTGYVTTYGYTADGRLSQFGIPKTGATPTSPGPLTQFTYDDAGRLKVVTGIDPDGSNNNGFVSPITNYEYDEFGRLKTVTDPDPDGASVPDKVLYTGPRGDVESGLFGTSGDQPVIGDWNGDGLDEIGVFRGGRWWYLDVNGDGGWTTGSDFNTEFGASGDKGVVGRWDSSSATDRIGIFRNGTFYLDSNGNGAHDTTDFVWNFGTAGDTPIAGDWNGDGIDEIGIFRNGAFALDLNGNGYFDPGIDASFNFGQTGDVPVVGDWNGDGIDEVGIVRNAAAERFWFLDTNGNRTTDTADLTFTYGALSAAPLVGNWTEGDALFGIGTFASAQWIRESYGYRIENQSSPVTSYEYTAVHQLKSETNAKGEQTAYDYDAAGNLTKITFADPDGAGALAAPVIEYIYDGLGRLTTLIEGFVGATAGQKRTTSYEYDKLDRLTKVTLPDPDGAGVGDPAPEWEYGYDNLGRLVWEEDPLNHRTTYVYNAAGDLWKVILPDPDGAGVGDPAPEWEYGYDNLGRMIWSDDPLDNRTEYGYDNVGRTISVLPPDTSETTYDYDDAGRLKKVSGPDPDGLAGPRGRAVTEYTYNADYGWLETIKGPDPGTGQARPITTYGYDLAGRLTSMIDALGQKTEYVYDDLDRLVKETRPDADGSDPVTGGPKLAGVWEYYYDANGNLLIEQDPLSRYTTYDYDALGRQTRTSDAAGKATKTVYNNYGDVKSLTDPLGNVTSWTYDALHRVTTETDPRSKVTSYDYDAANRLTEKVDRNGRKITYAYDNLDRLKTESWFAVGATTATNTISSNYDLANRLTSTSDNHSSYAYTYDGVGRVLSVDNAGNATGVPRTLLTSVYDLAGLRTSLTATNPADSTKNDFVNSYSYDDAGRMTRITQTDQAGGRAVADKRVDLSYDLLGRFDVISRYADLAATEFVGTSEYDYDFAGRLTGLTHKDGSAGTIAGYTYDYNRADQLVGATIPKLSGSDSYNYGYDRTGQLTTVLKNGVSDESYTYDVNGNRVSGGSTTETGNRLTADANYTYSYDDEGNRTRRTKKSDNSYTTYSYDHRNRLTAVRNYTSGNTLTREVIYRYDVNDNLIQRSYDADGNGSGGGVVEQYVYDSAPGKGGLDDQLLAFDGNGNVSHRYLHGSQVDQLFADEGAVDGVLWALSDRQGSVRDWAEYDSGTNDTSVFNHVEFDSFGNIESQSNGSHTVDIGYTGRYYDAATGLQWNRARWYDPGTGRWMNQDPIGFAAGDANLYRYVGNGPTNDTDPSGLRPGRRYRVNPKPQSRNSGGTRLQGGESVPPNFDPKGPNAIPDQLKGLWKISLATDGGSHCWIQFENLDTGKVHTTGRYALGYGGRYDDDGNQIVPPVSVPGVQFDQDTIKGEGVKSGMYPTTSVIRRDPYIFKDDPFGYETYGNNCATYGRDAWYYYSGEYFYMPGVDPPLQVTPYIQRRNLGPIDADRNPFTKFGFGH